MNKPTHHMINGRTIELTQEQVTECEREWELNEKLALKESMELEEQKKNMDSLKAKLSLSDDDVVLLNKMLKM